MKANQDPHWWTHEIESAWQRVREAVRRDWEQTKHDLDHFKHDLNEAKKQAAAIREDASPEGTEPHPRLAAFADYEPGYRFGYGARERYGGQFPEWTAELEDRLQKDWRATGGAGPGDWRRYQQAVRHGWDAGGKQKKPA